MNTPRTPRFVALALSVMMTLTVFYGVASLSSLDHAGQVLVRAAGAAPRV